ncbi:MAG TPA: hypothetical protein VF823_08080, partial [Anaerolineales bacterium]
MLEAGYGQADITPAIGTPLSGFIAREGKPSNRVDSRLYVRALALRQDGEIFLLLSYELLGLPAAQQARVLALLEEKLGSGFSPERCFLTAVHTHSGPPLGLLVGEPDPDPAYLRRLADQTLLASRQAVTALRPAVLYSAECRLPGMTYNRRALLPNGRVSIAPVPDLPVVRRGPLDDRLTVLVWCDLEGRGLAGVVHYACHGVAVLSQAIGSDIPGQLAAAVSEQVGAPCLFLQSAAGDINPTTVTAANDDLLAWMTQAKQHLRGLKNGLRPASDGSPRQAPLRSKSRRIALDYAPIPGVAAARRSLNDLEQIAAGDVTSPALAETIRSFKNTMNLPQDAALDPGKARFTALALAESARRTLAAYETGQPPAPYPLSLAA